MVYRGVVLAVSELAGIVKSVAVRERGTVVFELGAHGSDETYRCAYAGPNEVDRGDYIICTGHWVERVEGAQFRVSFITPSLPETAEGMQQYLASGKIPTIGPSLAAAIVSAFGSKSLEVMEGESARLTVVNGIGPERASRLGSYVAEHIAGLRLRETLAEIGLSDHGVARLAKRYGRDLVFQLSQNPYDLLARYPVFEFDAADQYARKIGFRSEVKQLRGAIRCILYYQSSQVGGSTLPEFVVREKVGALGLELPVSDEILSEITSDRDLSRVEGVDGVIYWVAGRHWELASSAMRAISAREIVENCLEQAISKKVHDKGSEFGAVTFSGAMTILRSRSWEGAQDQLRGIVDLASSVAPELRVVATAVSGAAADQLGYVLGRAATTLHKCLGIGVAGSSVCYTESSPLPADIIIVDEAHLLDLKLLELLLQGVSKTTAIILCGNPLLQRPDDIDLVLSSLIRAPGARVIDPSGCKNENRPGSMYKVARSIERGEFVPVSAESPEDLLHKMIDNPVISLWVKTDREARYALDQILPQMIESCGASTVQLISGQRKGLLGFDTLNKAYLRVFNPIAAARGVPKVQGEFLAVGDRLRVTRNLNSENLRTGDVVTIEAIGYQSVTVRRGQSSQTIDGRQLSRMQLGFASTPHRIAVRSAPVIILLLDGLATLSHNRQFLYMTASGSESRLVVIGAQRLWQKSMELDVLAREYPGPLELAVAYHSRLRAS